MNRFVCRICGESKGYLTHVLAYVTTRVRREFTVSYSCNACGATFIDPHKFSLNPRVERRSA